MDKVIINGHDFYYNDSHDPVVESLKRGHLFGLNNYVELSDWIINRNLPVLDVGAHIGTFAFVSAISNFPMICIEAGKQNFECLKATFSKFENIELHNSIISDSIKRVAFDENGPFGSINGDGDLETSTIDDIVGGRQIGGIKLDIEGYESEALDGAIKTLEQRIPILTEVNGHCLRLRNMKPQQFIHKIKEFGYVPMVKYDNKNYIEISDDQLFPWCVIDLICIHSSVIDKYEINRHKLADSFIEKIAVDNYLRSNEDCKAYFNSIGIGQMVV